MTPLTERQAECLRCVIKHVLAAHSAPTIREIGDQMGISSTNGVAAHIAALERKGYVVTPKGGRKRSIKVLRDASGHPVKMTLQRIEEDDNG